ncbi:MAG TPA: pyridoxine 5'-phosphate synthase [Bacteroidota bacterium]|nr:pyridoxine 5'-phosphate synthase [Bacteroidota bacterium]
MRLAVNIDHVATVREARGGNEPDPVEAARICESAGAEGIVCHLREDRRHIQDRDVELLRKIVRTKLDLEMAATKEIIGIALRIKPDFVTLVPEKRKELTTEGGLDVVRQKKHLREVIKRFHDHGIPVSLFVDPVKAQIETARAIESDMIEIHTGEYANARTEAGRQKHLEKVVKAAKLARSLGLHVNGGHGLNYGNVKPIAAIPEIEELSIGHAIITRAVFVGLENAVREMISLVNTQS